MTGRIGFGVVAIALAGLMPVAAHTATTSRPVAHAVDATGQWLVTNVPYAPWTFTLTQVGAKLTGTIRQRIGAPEGITIYNGNVKGNDVSFQVESPDSMRTVTFAGTIAGDSISFKRSVQVHPGGDSGATGLFGARGPAEFTAGREAAAALAGRLHWVVDTGVAYPPWTFDLKVDGGTVTGVATQALTDSASGFRAPNRGPFDIYDGKADGDAISFKLKTANGGRIIAFNGVRRGDQLAFTRSVQIVSGDSGRDGILGGTGATKFTAVLNGRETTHSVGLVLAPPPPATAPSGSPGTSEPPKARQTISYSGVNIDVTAIAAASDVDVVLAALRKQIDIVDRIKVSPDTRNFLKSVPIVMSASTGVTGASPGAYSGKTRSISMQAQLYDPDKPILLHELMHAYHDQKIAGGFGNPDILKLYQEAGASHRFPASSYMLSNVAEYFGMVASVYLHGSAARDPFARDSIRIKQPNAYRWLENEFGPR
jgi:hypothetical protein